MLDRVEFLQAIEKQVFHFGFPRQVLSMSKRLFCLRIVIVRIGEGGVSSVSESLTSACSVSESCSCTNADALSVGSLVVVGLCSYPRSAPARYPWFRIWRTAFLSRWRTISRLRQVNVKAPSKPKAILPPVSTKKRDDLCREHRISDDLCGQQQC